MDFNDEKEFGVKLITGKVISSANSTEQDLLQNGFSYAYNFINLCINKSPTKSDQSGCFITERQ